MNRPIAANNQTLFRMTIGAEIERLIALLDNLDGDCDLEDTADVEQALGWPAHGPSCLRNTVDDDREVEEASGYGDYEGMIVEEQGEPSLGWTVYVNQDTPDRGKTTTFHVDLELDESDDEPNGEDADRSMGGLAGGSGL
ncbi:hypothetical protein [Pararhizobium sp.]|uniref:hypothetical protein n=1 Tax=Pararhizobium sp. TaxID=1977563 RepID=UPI00271F743F|nr:hypothetical protein [Pararhizobium sp.]MDO9416225.1 hypothetical protein [Pararhizobium sp.]